MAKYRPIFMEIWNDEDEFLKYTDEEKTLFFYLSTNRDCTESGIYKISPRQICFLLNWETAVFNGTIEAIKNNVLYDEEKKIVFVKNYYRYNGQRRGNPEFVAKGISNDMNNFKTHLWHIFIKTYHKFIDTFQKHSSNIPQSNTNTDTNNNTNTDNIDFNKPIGENSYMSKDGRTVIKIQKD